MYLINNTVIDPRERFCDSSPTPRYAVICHHPSAFDALKKLEEEGFLQKVVVDKYWKSASFTFDNIPILLINAYFGQLPSIHRLFEFFIRGVEIFVSFTASGGIASDINIGDYIVVSEAFREDRISNAFATPEEPALTDPTVTEALKKACIEESISFKIGKVLTTGSIYAYTYQDVRVWKKTNVLCVESETASLLIGAGWLSRKYENESNKPLVGSIVYISDIVPDARTKSWHSKLDSIPGLLPYKEQALRICILAIADLHRGDNKC